MDAKSGTRVAVCFGLGISVALVLLVAGAGAFSAAGGWDIGSILFLVWVWAAIWPLDANETALRALRDDPRRLTTDALILGASVASLLAVGGILIKASHSSGTTKDLLIGLGAVTVVVAWGVVHTVFTLHYARLYYRHPPGGISFNQPERPRYTDFAYLAFTIGMTFQVSDTDIQDQRIRATILRHMWLSFIFGAVIIATTINLVAGLTTK